MNKKLKHFLIFSVSLLLIFTCTFGVLGALKIPVVSLLDNAKSSSTPKTFKYEYNNKEYKNEYERLLASDGLIYGMDVDWFGDATQGNTSLGQDTLVDMPSQYNEISWRKNITNIKALGFNCVNVWLLQGGVGGVSFNKDGIATGLTDDFISNLKSMLDIAREVGIDILPAITPHGLSSFFYRTVNGLTAPERAYKYYRFYWDGKDSEARNAYYENAVSPLCNILADYQDIIPIVALTIENGTGMVSDAEKGMFLSNGPYGSMSWDSFSSFVDGLSDEVKKVMPNMMTSVEDVGWTSNQFKYNDTKVDLIGRNIYDSSANITDPKDLFITRPTYIGEFNTSETESGSYTEEKSMNVILKFFPNAQSVGYKGGFFFSWDRGAGSGLNMFSKGTADNYEGLRLLAIPLSYQINQMKNEYRNEAYGNEIPVLNKPAMFYYTGGKSVYWVGVQNAVKYNVERSVNGGAWEKIAEVSSDNALDNGLFYYNDNKNYDVAVNYKNTHNNKLPKMSYRVVAVNKEGASSTSEPGNNAEYFIPEELMVDGGFEEAGKSAISTDSNSVGKWYQVGYNVGEFEKNPAIAHSGSYYLHIDHAKNIGYHDLDYNAQLKNNVILEAGKKYQLTYWCKNSITAGWAIGVSVRDSKNNELCAYTLPDTEDDEWRLVTLTFLAPDDGKATVTVIFNHKGESEPAYGYIDDFSIKELR